MTMMLEARDLYCERDERTLFRGLSFTVDAGEWVQVTGVHGERQPAKQRPLVPFAVQISGFKHSHSSTSCQKPGLTSRISGSLCAIPLWQSIQVCPSFTA